MAECKPKKRTASATPSPSMAQLRQALSRRKKAELVAGLLELAQADRRVRRHLTARFAVTMSPRELVAATRQAIADATAFDPRDINRNFDYDYEAYAQVKRNLARLVEVGQVRLAMQLALELMKRGSQQVEMSDEGMMTDDIEECLTVVLKAVPNSGLRAGEGNAWCSAMLDNDRVGFIAQETLESLRNHFQEAVAH